jgi:hypothetical protein
MALQLSAPSPCLTAQTWNRPGKHPLIGTLLFSLLARLLVLKCPLLSKCGGLQLVASCQPTYLVSPPAGPNIPTQRSQLDPQSSALQHSAMSCTPRRSQLKRCPRMSSSHWSRCRSKPPSLSGVTIRLGSCKFMPVDLCGLCSPPPVMCNALAPVACEGWLTMHPFTSRDVLYAINMKVIDNSAFAQTAR